MTERAEKPLANAAVPLAGTHGEPKVATGELLEVKQPQLKQQLFPYHAASEHTGSKEKKRGNVYRNCI